MTVFKLIPIKCNQPSIDCPHVICDPYDTSMNSERYVCKLCYFTDKLYYDEIR